jgi:predicted nucleic acid-binding protein
LNRFFADTFYWVALIHRKDTSNKAVLEFSRTLASAVLVTTDEVLTEVLAFCSADQSLRREAVIVVRGILAARNVRVIPQSRTSFLDGLTLYEERPDKGYSLADCISMQIMRREGLTDVLSNDRHFEQEGFREMFRS